MAKNIYRVSDGVMIYAEDTAWGTAGTPAGTSYVDRVQSFSATVENNPIFSQGIGDGLNAKNVMNGPADVSGSMTWELTDPSFLQYGFLGTKSGGGTAADPYEIAEASALGYAAGEVNTLTLECGLEGATEDTMAYDGVFFESVTINCNSGEKIMVNASWTGRNAVASTTNETYTGPTNRPFTFVDGAVTVGSDTVGELMNFSITCNTEYKKSRDLSRFLMQPVAIRRRYTFSGTIRLHFDDTASTLSGTELRNHIFNGTSTGTSIIDTAENTTVAISMDLTEGAEVDDRVLAFDLETGYLSNFTQPIELDSGDIEVSFNGVALAGLTDSTANVAIRWYTLA